MKTITTLIITVATTLALGFTGCSNPGATSSSSSQKAARSQSHHDATGGSQGGGDLSTQGARGPQ